VSIGLGPGKNTVRRRRKTAPCLLLGVCVVRRACLVGGWLDRRHRSAVHDHNTTWLGVRHVFLLPNSLSMTAKVSFNEVQVPGCIQPMPSGRRTQPHHNHPLPPKCSSSPAIAAEHL